VPDVLKYLDISYPFLEEAPVGNSKDYLNQRELAADDSLSLLENNFLLTPSQLFAYKSK
jgi:hypothetical protein